jgi:hypothetical protein
MTGINNEKIFGFTHLCIFMFLASYGLIFNKNKFDYVYLFCMILTILSWTCYNGECPVSYYIKKQKNQNYISGQNSNDLNDIYSIFGDKYKNYVYTFLQIFILLLSISLYLVFKRNNFTNYIFYGLPFFNLVYILLLQIYSLNGVNNNKTFLFLQEIYKLYIMVVIILIFIEVKNKKRLVIK